VKSVGGSYFIPEVTIGSLGESAEGKKLLTRVKGITSWKIGLLALPHYLDEVYDQVISVVTRRFLVNPGDNPSRSPNDFALACICCSPSGDAAGMMIIDGGSQNPFCMRFVLSNIGGIVSFNSRC
jgi:hypothetical protein